jgi:pimeloyl-ACP methyl ester carboxylesterase
MVLFEFAARYPQRCHSLIIVAQGADYQIAPHPFIWLLHELFVRLPVEYILPAWFLRRSVINYIVAKGPVSSHLAAAPTHRAPARGGPSIMNFHDQDRSGGVTLSPFASLRVNSAKGLARWAQRCFAALSMTFPVLSGKFHLRDTCPPGRVPTAFPHEQYVENQAQTGSPGSVLPRSLIEEQFRKIALWPFVYKYSVLPVIHYFDMRSRLNSLTMPVLLINRTNDVLSPEEKTRWLAGHLPNCAGYHVIAGGERFFMYSQAGTVNALIEEFLTSRATAAEN